MKRSSRRRSSQNSGLLIGVVLCVIVLVVGIFLYVSHTSDTASTASDPAVFNAVTRVNPALLAQIGTGNAQSTIRPVKGSSSLTGPTGKPEFFYVGGEFCPYCAAQRWSVVVAVSRFGTFGPLSQITSSEQNLSSLSFHNSTYKSQYVDFVGMETKDNQGYQCLQRYSWLGELPDCGDLCVNAEPACKRVPGQLHPANPEVAF